MKKLFKKTIDPKLNVKIADAKETKKIEDETPEERNENFKQFVYYALEMVCTELDGIADKLYKITRLHNAILNSVCEECEDTDCDGCDVPKAKV